MSLAYYQCPIEYQCLCNPGVYVSLTTVRRHRDIALHRMQLEQRNKAIALPLPPPIFLSEEGSILIDEESDDSFISEYNKSYSTGASLENITNSTQNGDSVNNFNEETVWCSYKEYSDNHSEKNVSLEHDGRKESTNYQCLLSFTNTERSNEPDVQLSGTEANEFIWERKHKVKNFIDKYGWYCGFYLRHNLTLNAMDDILQKDFPQGIKCWKTIRRRLFDYAGLKVSKHPYCSRYHELLSIRKGRNKFHPCSHSACASSPALVKELTYIGLWERLVARLQNNDEGPELLSYIKNEFRKSENSDFEELYDFFSGNGFREYAEGLNDFSCSDTDSSIEHLFLFISTDGAPAFRSTINSFWPVIVYLGNIPPDRRYKYQNIFPVLCIPGNPNNLESFLFPLFEELESLRDGRECTLWNGRRVVVKCHVMHVLGDLPAKKQLCLVKGVNAYVPCLYCDIQGILSESSNTVYYPDYLLLRKRRREEHGSYLKKVLWDPANVPIRSEQTIRMVFQELNDLRVRENRVEEKKLIRKTGIIGECEIVRRFPSIKPYISMPIDLMHLLFENIAPLLLNIWTGDVDTEKDFSFLCKPIMREKVYRVLINSGSGIIDTIRRPRGVKERKLWKADEWRTFVLTTSLAALHQFLPNDILSGWWLFCRVCELAMSPNLSTEDLEDLSECCTQFYRHYSNTYYQGKSNRLHLMK